MNRLNVLAGLALGSAVLTACVPASVRTAPVPEVRATSSVSEVSFYPAQAGLMWTYLPQGEPASNAPYILRSNGPTIFKGQPVSEFSLTGRGAEQTWYRQVSDSGVQLLGFTKPGVLVNLEPAWRELPPAGDLRVGASWEGESRVTVMDTVKNVVAGGGTLKYRYDIQDRRQVSTPTGNYDVFVITRRVSDDLGGLFPAVQQMYYAPFVGEVRTYEDLLLTARNYSAAPAAPQPAGSRSRP